MLILEKLINYQLKYTETFMKSHLVSGAGFPAGTRIHTDKGLISIQDIKVGSLVLTMPKTSEGELCYKPVIRAVSYENKEIWQLTYFEIKANTDLSKLNKSKLLQLSRKGKMISNIATPNLTFWVKDVGWTCLDELKNGQVIETSNQEIIILVFMVNPLRKTSMQNVAGSYHASNIFDADKKGFDIDNVEYFSLLEYGLQGPIRFLGDGNTPSPICVNGESVHVHSEIFRLKTYCLEVEDYNTYFVTKQGLWVHDTNVA